MMDFPASPSIGQAFTPSGGPTYIWDGAKWNVSTTVPLITAVGGRLSNFAGSPVVQGNPSATSICWNPYLGSYMPIWNGSTFVFAQVPGVLTNTLANSAVGNAGPAAVVANTIYDLFIWNNAGTLTLTRGPAWTASTDGASSRGTGAGTTELSLVQGIHVNASNIVNGPAAGYGTYVGTMMTDGSGTLTYNAAGPGSNAAVGGFQANISVWNKYNRVDVGPGCSDTTATWTMAAGGSFRAQNNNNGSRIKFVAGLVEDMFFAVKEQMQSIAGSAISLVSIGFNATTARAAGASISRNANSSGVTMAAFFSDRPTLGSNYINGVEACEGTGTCTFYGGAPGSQNWQETFTMRWRA